MKEFILCCGHRESPIETDCKVTYEEASKHVLPDQV